MHTQNFFINKGTNGKNIENISKNFPEFEVVFSFALVRVMMYISHKSHKFY